MGAQLASQIILLDLLSAIFGTIVIGICVMSVANTMMKSVTERVREIGTLRSLGFLRAHIVYMFALEGMFISVLACAIGLTLTIALGQLIGAANVGVYRRSVQHAAGHPGRLGSGHLGNLRHRAFAARYWHLDDQRSSRSADGHRRRDAPHLNIFESNYSGAPSCTEKSRPILKRFRFFGAQTPRR